MWFWFGVVGSFAFIIIQLILLIDFAHTWNQSWLEKAEEGNSKCWFAGVNIVNILYFPYLDKTLKQLQQ